MAKRGSPTIPKAGGGGASPLFSASVVVIAIGYGAILLVQKGRLSWPPYELLGSAFTLFGCLGLVGPVILARRESGQAYLGELVWFACGMLIWMHDLALLARGEWRASAWATPMSYQSLGLVFGLHLVSLLNAPAPKKLRYIWPSKSSLSVTIRKV